jgi:hypothetical protein
VPYRLRKGLLYMLSITSELQLLLTFKQSLAAQSQYAEIVART